MKRKPSHVFPAIRQSCCGRLAVYLLLCWPLASCCGSVALAEDSENSIEHRGGKSSKWALLIGIEKYHRATRLRYTLNDVRQIAESLRRRGDYAGENIMEIVDTADNPRYQPLRASLLAELPKFLARPGPEDHILVYFSGHGFRDKEGKLYLAPIDCDPGNPAPTGVSVEWFRNQLAACKAKTKLLILDACHAGSEKGDEETGSIASKDLGSPFRDLQGVVTLASSTSEEKSLIWEEKEQSLFSFWMNQGLKGHADSDADGSVTIDELYAYVYRNVTHTAKKMFPRSQTPVRILRSGTLGVPEVVRLKPQSVKQVLADIAEQLSWAMQEQRLSKVGVLEFSNDTKFGEMLGANFGLLGRYCAEELERRLMVQGTGKFSVVDRRRLQQALATHGFGLEDMASSDALMALSERAGGMPVIAQGTLRNRMGRVVSLQCKLIQTEHDELAGSAGGTAVLNESEWGMLGRSVVIRPEDRRPPPPTGEGPAQDASSLLIERLDHRAQGAHPLSDSRFPFRVRIMVKQPGSLRPVEREGVFHGNDMFVPLRRGEVYEIWVENLSNQLVLMRLLVDGLNTLPEREGPTKAMVVEHAPKKTRWVAALRVNLGEARHWILDPRRARVCAVRGFFSETGASGKRRESQIVDAQQSQAARQQYTEQLGLITAAFYAPKRTVVAESPGRVERAPEVGAGRPGRVTRPPGSNEVGSPAPAAVGSPGPVGGVRGGNEVGSTLGTDFGAERTEEVQQGVGIGVGDLLAVVNIRYVEPEAIKAMQ